MHSKMSTLAANQFSVTDHSTTDMVVSIDEQVHVIILISKSAYSDIKHVH